MRRRRQREIEGTGLSFLDCICCGFGAVILLLVVTKVREPVLRAEAKEEAAVDLVRLEQYERDLQQRLTEARADQQAREEEIRRKRGLRDNLTRELALLAQESDDPRPPVQDPEPPPPRPDTGDSAVLGLPADSEYVIFVFDTSGSMQRFNWAHAIRKLTQVLDVYPKVRGLQVLNDMGVHMFPSTKGKWLPDTAAGRRRIREYIARWNALSNSSPVEGIEEAIRTYYAPDKTISIYVFGDEFTGDSIQYVVDSIDRLNRKDAQGKRRVRIHAVGFPLIDPDTGTLYITGQRFAALMRILCERNGGTFIALKPG
jgi:hypothetical protein